MTDAAALQRRATGVILQLIAAAARDELAVGATGVRDCPFCSSVLRWRVEADRGDGDRQLRGACDTPDCFAFLS